MKPSFQTRVTPSYSRHAEIRMQQRSISGEAVELLLDSSEPIPVGAGALSYRFTKETWADAQTELGSKAAAFFRYRSAYVVESADGVIITAAWLQ
jgi:hypothetical protein